MAIFGIATSKRDELERKLASDPLDVSAAIAYAELLSEDDKPKAIGVLSKAGSGLQKKGKTLDAIAVYKKAVQIDPKGEVSATIFANMDLRRLLRESAKAHSAPEEPAPKPAAPKGAPAKSGPIAVKAPPGPAPALPRLSMPAPPTSSGIRRKKEALRGAVEGLPLLKDVPDSLIEPILEKMSLKTCEAGEIVFNEGDTGTSLYFVVSGQLAVGAKDDTGKVVALDALEPGDVLGEISFLSNVPRSATARAVGRAILLELMREDLEPVLKRTRKLAEALQILFRERVLDAVLAKSRLFRTLTKDERAQVARRLMPLAAKPGDKIIKEGAADNVLYLLKRGECQVTTTRDGHEVLLALLKPHDFFGDVAALRGTPRTATVTALTPIEFLCLSRPDLAAIMEQHPGIREGLEEIQLERFVSNSQLLSS